MTSDTEPPDHSPSARRDEEDVWSEIRAFYERLSPEARQRLYLSTPENEAAAAEAAERRRRDRPKLRLTPEASRALGSNSAELVWLQIRSMVSQVLSEYRQAGEELCQHYELGEDLFDLLGWLGRMDAVKGVNLVHNQVPDFDLQDIPHQPPLRVLRAVLEMAVNRAGLSESECRRLLRKAQERP